MDAPLILFPIFLVDMEKSSKSYKQDKITGQYDAIIIGSGLGGMSTAAFLAKEGKKCLVLERHYTPGGFTHVFSRRNYDWDVGVHYVGEVNRPYTLLAKMFKYITNGNLHWAEMGEVYDKMIFGNKVYEFRTGDDEFKAELKRHFPVPEDQKSIDDYVDLIRKTQKEGAMRFAAFALPWPLNWILGPRMRRKGLRNNKTTLEVMRSITKNEKLLAVLTGQFGDYGLPPSESSFLMHASLVKHYLKGGNYPIGGSARIYETIAPIVQAAGGQIFTNAPVKEVIIKDNKAIGVRMADGKEFFAPIIVSNAGIINSYQHLLPEAERKKHGFDELMKNVKPSVGHVCLYVGLNHPKSELKLGTANYWIFPDNYDHDKNISEYLANPDAEIPVVYVSFPAAKDPDWEKRHPERSTIEIITLAPYEWYRQWEDKRWKKRGADYEAVKEKLAQRLLEKLYEQEPNLRGKVDYYELSTPLSTQHFVNYKYGELYGIDHDPKRFEQTFLQAKTPIKNFYLTGQDIVSCGVGGALVSGLLTASAIVGKNLMKKLEE